jgi:hypothetical protein
MRIGRECEQREYACAKLFKVKFKKKEACGVQAQALVEGKNRCQGES